MRKLFLLSTIIYLIIGCNYPENKEAKQFSSGVLELKDIDFKTVLDGIENPKVDYKKAIIPFKAVVFSEDMKKPYKDVEIGISKKFKTLSTLYKDIKKKVVSINFYIDFKIFSTLPETYRSFFNKEKNIFTIPGVVIGDKDILTFYPILKQASIIFIKDKKGDNFLYLKGFDEGYNIALLESERVIEDISRTKLPKKDLNYAPGQFFYGVGSPFLLRESFLITQVNFLYYSHFYNTVTHFFSHSLSSISNVGGMIFNKEGVFVGMVSCFDPYYKNSGLVITSNVINRVLKKLKKGYSIFNKPWFGIYLKQIGQQVRVKGVVPNGPADIATLKDGDIIEKINGVEIYSKTMIKKILNYVQPGNYTIFKVKRETKEIEIKIKATTKPLEYTVEQNIGNNILKKKKLGIVVSYSEKGVIVDDVEEGSIGFIYGIKKGDCLLALNHTILKTENDFYLTLSKIPEKDIIKFKIERGKQVQYIAFKKP